VNARLYLNTSTNGATARIDGGGFSPPPVRAYSDVIVRFRLAREIEGESFADDREIYSVSARIGYQDAPPLSGTVSLDITLGGDTVTTAALAYNATAAQVETAINAALDASALDALHPCTVESLTEGYRIVFADTDETVVVSAATNKLWPLSFVNADAVEFDGGRATMLAYRQTPVAETASAEETVPPVPSVTREQMGYSEDGVSINEVQKITLSPAYAGATWRLVWDGVKGAILPGSPTVEQLQAALDALAPTGGLFNLIALEDGVLVEFAGSMAGEAQELMTAEEFTPPPTEWLVHLATDTLAMRTMMAGAGADGEIDLPMDIRVIVLDPDAPEGVQELNFPFEINFTRPVSDGGRNVSANLDYTQPLSRTSNTPFSPNALLVGNRARRFTVGDGVAESFVLPHNLGSLSGVFTADASTDICTKAGHDLATGDPVTLSTTGTLPGGLSAGGTYFIVAATTDTFKLAETPNGTAIDITSAGTGTHTITVADGTTDVVFVEVWEAGGLRRRLSPEDYTVAITTADSVTVSGFAATPTAGQYQVVVMTAGRPATYQAHQHTIAEVDGLQLVIDGIHARLTALEALAPAGVSLTRPSEISAGTIARALGSVWRVPRARNATAKPDTLMTWKTTAEELGEAPRRPLRLLPAVHDATVEALPSTLPAPAAIYAGRVFTTATTRTDFPGGLYPGDFAACDGREWYRVAPEDAGENTFYPTAFEMELFRTTVNASQLTAGSQLSCLFGFEASVVMLERLARVRRTAVGWTLLIESGTPSADTAPDPVGANLDDYFSSPVVMLSQRIHLTEIPSQHRFGITVTRPRTGALTATAIRYLGEVATTAPATPSFAIRARLCQFDTENAPTDARGIVAVRGLDVGLDGSPDQALGILTIK
jgi:hypothetical protein